uniref:Uncharacterized protein n=1 Tax=Melopsittacus undulatus TaxID=13146 RepID=A0A8V5H2E2_MELUD
DQTWQGAERQRFPSTRLATGASDHNSSGHSPSGHSASSHSSSGHSPSGHRASDHNSSGYNPSGNSPLGHRASGHNSSGYNPSGNSPSGHNSSGHSPPGHSSSGHKASDHNSSGYNPSGHRASGHTWGHNPSGLQQTPCRELGQEEAPGNPAYVCGFPPFISSQATVSNCLRRLPRLLKAWLQRRLQGEFMEHLSQHWFLPQCCLLLCQDPTVSECLSVSNSWKCCDTSVS